MQYVAHVHKVRRPIIGLPVHHRPNHLIDADWATMWMIDETNPWGFTGIEISIATCGPSGGALTNRIYVERRSDVADALTAYGFSFAPDAPATKWTFPVTRTAVISHLLADLDGVSKDEGARWLDDQPELHRIIIEPDVSAHLTPGLGSTAWTVTRTDDTDQGVYYDTKSDSWEIY